MGAISLTLLAHFMFLLHEFNILLGSDMLLRYLKGHFIRSAANGALITEKLYRRGKEKYISM